MSHNQRNERRRNVSYGIIGAVFLVVGFLFALLVNTPRGTQNAEPAAIPLSPTAYRIASRFDCPCGACTKVVTTCECPEAAEMKSFIVDKLNQGLKPPAVVQAVSRRYLPPAR